MILGRIEPFGLELVTAVVQWQQRAVTKVLKNVEIAKECVFVPLNYE